MKFIKQYGFDKRATFPVGSVLAMAIGAFFSNGALAQNSDAEIAAFQQVHFARLIGAPIQAASAQSDEIIPGDYKYDEERGRANEVMVVFNTEAPATLKQLVALQADAAPGGIEKSIIDNINQRNAVAVGALGG